MAVEQVNWMVTGMTCAGCAHSAQGIADGTPGLSGVQVRYASGTLRGEVNWDAFNLENFRKDLASAGYQLHTSYESPQDRILRQQRELKRKKSELLFAAALALPLLVIGMSHQHGTAFLILQILLATALSFYFGRRIHKKAFQLSRRWDTNMDTLVSLGSLVAYFSSLFNVLTGQFHLIYFESAGLIIFFILIGKYLEERGKVSNGKALATLVELQPDTAIALREQGPVEVAVADLELDEHIRIAPGGRIPADGIVVEGESSIDESTFTGEPFEVEKKPGSAVWAGTVNGPNELTVRITATGRTSALGGIIDAVMEAQGTVAPIEKLTDRISKIFVPAILLLSLATGLLWWWIGDGKPLLFAINVLVIACPCALGLATPLAVVAATGLGTRNGLLVRNAAAFQQAQSLKFAILDKTGTLTEGKPTVSGIQWMGAQQIDVLTALNARGNHPLNKALTGYLKVENEGPAVKRFKALPGKGVQGKIDNQLYYLGSGRYVEEVLGSPVEATEGTASFFFTEESVLARIDFQDALKSEAPNLIAALKSRGITPVLASGDAQGAVDRVAKELGINEANGALLPLDKVAFVERFAAQGTTLMVGDGINDTAALSKADIGVSMADGTHAAQESADVVLMREGISQLEDFFSLAGLTMSTIRGNLWWAFGYNLVAIPVAAGVFYSSFGWELTPMMASIAMSFSSLGVVLNSLRMHQRFKIKLT